MKIRLLFDKYQKYLLAFSNTKYGRMYLSLNKFGKIKNNYKIIKVTPDGIHFFTGEYTKKGLPICQAVFFSRSPYLKKFRLALEGLEIASDVIGKIYNPEFVIPHFGDLITPRAWLPLVMRTTLTQYPDASPESTSVDGLVKRATTNEEWTTIRGGVGTAFNDSASTFAWWINGYSSSGRYEYLERGIALFDTSSIGASSTVNSGTLSFHGESKVNNGNFSPNSCIYGATPGSNTALANSDFQQTGTTQMSDTAITYTSFSTSGYNDYPLNTAGENNIDVDSISKFSFKNKTYDADGAVPEWDPNDSKLSVYSADNGSNKPKLVVDYTLPFSPLPTFHNP